MLDIISSKTVLVVSDISGTSFVSLRTVGSFLVILRDGTDCPGVDGNIAGCGMTITP